MAFQTRAFQLFYKRLGPTGSNNATTNWRGYLDTTWYNEFDNSGAIRMSSSFFNFPMDSLQFTRVSTRDTTTETISYRALPWTSHACDFLWNTTIPSWSFRDVNSTPGGVNITERYWSVSLLESRSFYYDYLGGGQAYGVQHYNVTSSWKVVDSKLLERTSSFRYMDFVQYDTSYPTYVGAVYDEARPDSSSHVAYDITNTKSTNSTSSFDGRYFDNGAGTGITRADISRSLATMSLYAGSSTTLDLRRMTRALKQRRLFFPTPVSDSGTPQGTDYWFNQNTGYKASDLFDENGGVYSVSITIKKSPEYLDYYPDSNTYMMVYIHDVASPIPVPSARVPGAAGWYPPENNIVKIGNGYGGSPTFAFNDIETGDRIERFDFNVIQYGYPAQFCIEVTGSSADNKYFGIIVDDVQICKIGVTTDPRFIKPTTIAQTTQNSTSPAPKPSEE